MLIDTRTTYPVECGSHSNCIPMIAWGSIEPHGEQLPYLTDTILAGNIAIDSAEKSESRCLLLPSVSMGSQNPGQWDKTMCIHFSQETQKSFLSDIVSSLEIQGFDKLVIVNGHNGNSFKGIVRDIEFSHPRFKIYICNYLDAVEKMKPSDTIPFPDTDDHAGFTETSLMMHYAPMLMDFSRSASGVPDKTNYALSTMWTPREWDKYSMNTRIGDASMASASYGEEIADFVTTEIARDLESIAWM